MADCVRVAMAGDTPLSSQIILASFNRVINKTPPRVLLRVSHLCTQGVTFKNLFAVGMCDAIIAEASDIHWRVVIGVFARYLLFLDMRSYLIMGIGILMLVHSLYINSYIGKA